MKVKQMLDQMAIAAYELAEAETLEKRAAMLRVQATKRVAQTHACMKHELEQYKESQPKAEA